MNAVWVYVFEDELTVGQRLSYGNSGMLHSFESESGVKLCYNSSIPVERHSDKAPGIVFETPGYWMPCGRKDLQMCKK